MSSNGQSANHTTIASLPWYDLREVRAATDALWAQFSQELRRAGLTNVPTRLNRELAYERQWLSGDFLFGQACGYDVQIAFADQLQTVATPCYSAPGCRDAEYSSYVVVREDAPYESLEDLRGARCVVNTPTSHSGMNTLRALIAPLHRQGRFFANVQWSGSHERSLQMIQRGEADVAAVDCVTHALLVAHRPQGVAKCRVLQCTPSAPAPPYVTAAATPPDVVATLQHALQRTLASPAMANIKQTLMLREIRVLARDAYSPMASLRAMADAHGYHQISETAPH